MLFVPDAYIINLMMRQGTHTALTLRQAWENAEHDTRAADVVFQSLTRIIQELSGGELNELAAQEAARTLVGYYRTLIFKENDDGK